MADIQGFPCIREKRETTTAIIKYQGIYIMQNTMVRGGGWPAGEKNEIRS